MSPYRPSNQRRRSLSSFHDQLCIDLCHPSTKRTHSRQDHLPRQWDLESWRRGKRARTQQTSSLPAASESTQGVTTPVELTPTPLFPSTSAAFDLRPRNSRLSPSQPHCKPTSHPVSTDQNISALQAYAFWELQQNITEASEGFVQRMRDWESSRPQGSRQTHRLGTPFPPYTLPRGREFTRASETTSEDGDIDSDIEDDVLILSDETSSVTRASSPGAASPVNMRARSLGDMDLDSPEMTPTIPPELTHTVASSSTSSLLSLTPPPVMPPPSSREEKAIAALTLALASGAAGLNDYSAVREALGFSAHADGASEVGEMWR